MLGGGFGLGGAAMAMVGGYALIRRGIAAAQQIGQPTDKTAGGKDAE